MAASRPVLCGHGEGIDLPAGGDHCVLKVGHEPPGGFGAAGARPLASGKVQSQDIEQRVALRRVQTAIRRSIGIVGIQGSNQLAVLLDDESAGRSLTAASYDGAQAPNDNRPAALAVGQPKSTPRAGCSISPGPATHMVMGMCSFQSCSRSVGHRRAFCQSAVGVARHCQRLGCASRSPARAAGIRVGAWIYRRLWGGVCSSRKMRSGRCRGEVSMDGTVIGWTIGSDVSSAAHASGNPRRTPQRKPPPQDTAKYRVTNWPEYDAALVKRRRLCAAESHDRRRACAIRPVQSPRPAGRPWHRCRTTRDAASTRCPARSAGTRPAPAGPDPSACPYDLAAGGRPEAVQPQRLPQLPASQQAPHCRGRHNRMSDRRSWTTDASGATPVQRSSGNSASVRGCPASSSRTSIALRQTAACEELISPKYRTWRCTTRPPATRLFSTTLQ